MITGQFTLLGADRQPYRSARPGLLGGHRRSRIYGRLDCRTALRALAAGGYTASRVFFADEATAVAVGYRPCAVCLPGAYRSWKARMIISDDDGGPTGAPMRCEAGPVGDSDDATHRS